MSNVSEHDSEQEGERHTGHRSSKRVIIKGNSDASTWVTSVSYGDIYGGETLSNWTSISLSFIATTATTRIEFVISSVIYIPGQTTGFLWVKHLMLEAGTISSAWSPAPQDMQQQSEIMA